MTPPAEVPSENPEQAPSAPITPGDRRSDLLQMQQQISDTKNPAQMRKVEGDASSTAASSPYMRRVEDDAGSTGETSSYMSRSDDDGKSLQGPALSSSGLTPAPRQGNSQEPISTTTSSEPLSTNQPNPSKPSYFDQMNRFTKK